MIRPILTSAAVLSLAALPAFATTTEQFDMSVKVDRASLTTVAGAEQALTQISQDVHERCVAETEDFPFSTSYAVSFCEKRTLKTAIATINDPNLTAAYKASLVK